MKREIKFRAQAIHNGEWVYGLPVHYNRDPRIEKWTMYEESGLGVDIEEETLCQFTGLYDKNGKEIYEGDIVTMMRTPEKRRKRELVRHIVTSRNVCDWVFKSLAVEVCGLLMEGHSDFDSYKFEVMGNIYDNPELAQPYTLNLREIKPRKRKNNKIDVEIKFKV